MVWSDAIRALFLIPRVERLRRGGPKQALDQLRSRGASAASRHPAARDDLRRAIAAVDRRVPGGANCYRRVLLEIALDAGAARETVHLGFRLDDAQNPGHAWLGDVPPGEDSFDTIVEL